MEVLFWCFTGPFNLTTIIKTLNLNYTKFTECMSFQSDINVLILDHFIKLHMYLLLSMY